MNSGTVKRIHARERPFLAVFIAAIISLTLSGCATSASGQRANHTGTTVDARASSTQQAISQLTATQTVSGLTQGVTQSVCPVVEPAVCEPEPDLATEAAVRKLVLGNEWHKEGRYSAALEAYEAVLVEHASLLADAYALWGIIALHLDRDNPAYDRDRARTVSYVLNQRASKALKDEAAAEARLLWFSAQTMLVADVSKDNVVSENRNLRKELAEREEAIQRLRELTVGR